jgi:hypothetical protein
MLSIAIKCNMLYVVMLNVVAPSLGQSDKYLHFNLHMCIIK